MRNPRSDSRSRRPHLAGIDLHGRVKIGGSEAANEDRGRRQGVGRGEQAASTNRPASSVGRVRETHGNLVAIRSAPADNPRTQARRAASQRLARVAHDRRRPPRAKDPCPSQVVPADPDGLGSLEDKWGSSRSDDAQRDSGSAARWSAGSADRCAGTQWAKTSSWSRRSSPAASSPPTARPRYTAASAASRCRR